MWSRLLVPLNRSLARKSFCHSGNSVNAVQLMCKHTEGAARQDLFDRTKTNQHQKSSKYQDEIHDNEKLLEKNDRKIFGTLNRNGVNDKANAIEEDDEHYQNMPLRRDQLPQYRYENMVKKHIRDKRLKEAIDVVEVRMKEDRVPPDYYIYDLLIMECGRLGYTQQAFKLYNRMKKRDLKVTGPTYAALFNSIANTIQPTESLTLAQNLRKALIQNAYPMNEKIYNTMIKAFGRCGDIDTAFQLVDEMKEKRLQLKIDTMNHLLQVCCSDKQYGFRHALLVWHRIYYRQMLPDIYSFNLMLRCTRDCAIGDIGEMRKVIGRILKSSQESVRLKSNKNNTLLIEAKPSTVINKNLHNSPEVADNSESSSTSNKLVTKDVCDQMPNLLAKLPHLGSIVQLSMVNSAKDRLMLLGGFSGFINEMEKAGVWPNVKTFAQMLETIPSTRDAENELIERIRKMRVWCDTDFFNLLMKRRILRRDYEGAKQVEKMIELAKLDPDIATYGVMAMGCVTHQQAKEFREMLIGKGVRINIEILGALMKNAVHVKDYDYVIDILQFAVKENIRPSFKFTEIVNGFNVSRYRSLQAKKNDEELAKYNRFYRIYKVWKTTMELDGLSRDEISRRLNQHPWKQLKEGEKYGIEIVKNKRTRRIWKRQLTLAKLKPARLEQLLIPEPGPSANTIENADETNDK